MIYEVIRSREKEFTFMIGFKGELVARGKFNEEDVIVLKAVNKSNIKIKNNYLWKEGDITTRFEDELKIIANS